MHIRGRPLLDRGSRVGLGLLARLPSALVRDVAAIVRRLVAIRAAGVAAEIAFFGALAVVPAILALVALLAALLGEQGEVAVLGAVRRATAVALVGEARAGVLESVQRIVEGPRPGLVSASVVALVAFASRGFAATLRGLRLVYGTSDHRPWWRDRLAAVALTLAAIVIGAVMLGLFAVIPFVALLGLDGGVLGSFADDAWSAARVAALGVLAVLFLTVLYHEARGRHGRWLRDLPGALIATGAATLVTLGYRVVLVISPRSLRLSGASDDVVGAVLLGVLATLVLFALLAGAALLGAAFNAEHDPDLAGADPASRDGRTAADSVVTLGDEAHEPREGVGDPTRKRETSKRRQ